jgi:hypothetical protein
VHLDFAVAVGLGEPSSREYDIGHVLSHCWTTMTSMLMRPTRNLLIEFNPSEDGEQAAHAARSLTLRNATGGATAKAFGTFQTSSGSDKTPAVRSLHIGCPAI